MATWTIKGNWAAATSHAFEYGSIPRQFTKSALRLVLDLPGGDTTIHETFADSGLVFLVSNQEYARNVMHTIIQQILADPLADLGVLKTEYQAHIIPGIDFPSLPP